MVCRSPCPSHRAKPVVGLSRRLEPIWPELSRTTVAEKPAEPEPMANSRRRRATKKREVSLEKLEGLSDYEGPSPDAVKDDAPDED